MTPFNSRLPFTFRNQAVLATALKVGTLATGTVALAWRLINLNGGIVYLKFYDKATTPTVGTDIPVAIVPIFGTGVSEMELMAIDLNKFIPREFTQSFMWVACTTGIADTDTTAPGVGLDVQLKYNQ